MKIFGHTCHVESHTNHKLEQTLARWCSVCDVKNIHKILRFFSFSHIYNVIIFIFALVGIFVRCLTISNFKQNSDVSVVQMALFFAINSVRGNIYIVSISHISKASTIETFRSNQYKWRIMAKIYKYIIECRKFKRMLKER